MTSTVFRFFVLAMVALASVAGTTRIYAQDAETPPNPSPPGANLDVSLLTFGPGEEVWERFGHNAIEIRDRASGEARLYNYGMFDFSQENFFLNFARGKMLYRIAVGNPAEELPNYVAEGRWIVRQDLNLTPAQRAKLSDYLQWNARAENAQYRYDYFRANCSTRVRDALDTALDGAIKAQTTAPSRGFTYRMDADRLMRPDVAIMLGIDAGLGPYADQRLSYWDESFVPTQFMRHVREIKVHDESGNDVPLVANETEVNKARLAEPPEFPPQWGWAALATGIVAGIILLALARLRAQGWARVAFASVASLSALFLGCAGLILIGLWALTDHVSAWRNENILLFNPLCLLLLPTWLGSFRKRWKPSTFARNLALFIALCAVFAWFIKILPGFIQDNRVWLGLLIPIQLAFALVPLIAPFPIRTSPIRPSSIRSASIKSARTFR